MGVVLSNGTLWTK